MQTHKLLPLPMIIFAVLVGLKTISQLINYGSDRKLIGERFSTKTIRKHEHIRLLTHKLCIFSDEFHDKRKKTVIALHVSPQRISVKLMKNSVSVDPSSRNQ